MNLIQKTTHSIRVQFPSLPPKLNFDNNWIIDFLLKCKNEIDQMVKLVTRVSSQEFSQLVIRNKVGFRFFLFCLEMNRQNSSASILLGRLGWLLQNLLQFQRK